MHALADATSSAPISWVSIVTVIVAAIGAGLAGLTVWQTGRRENRKWQREALAETYVEFLNASFDGYVRRAEAARRKDQDTTGHAATAWAAHKRQTKSLSRLRIIAPNEVAEAADHLHEVERELYRMLFEDKPLSTTGAWAVAWEKLREKQRDARQRFIDEGRKSIGMRPGALIRFNDPLPVEATLLPNRDHMNGGTAEDQNE